jgi:hypothetical protein
MSDTARRHPFTVAAWILVGALVVAGVAGVGGDIVSRSIVVDLVAMWPLLAVVVLAGVAGWLRGRRRRARAGAILPLAIISALVFTAALHLGGWDQLPSAQARLTGPTTDGVSDTVQLTLQIPGDLHIGPVSDGAAYRVDPIMRGGGVGVPAAIETAVDGQLSVLIEEDVASGWYTFSGWRLSLSPGVEWRLILNGRLDADLAELKVASMAVAGSGLVALGSPSPTGGTVVAAGDLTISVPVAVAVTAVGNVVVPGGWEPIDDGYRSPPTEGPAWTIRVSGDSTVTIRQR